MKTVRHMIHSGNELREAREALGISQARLAEITNIPQHMLSAFELEKIALRAEMLEDINLILPKISDYDPIVSRRKRYRQHTYSLRNADADRAIKAQRTNGNRNYLEDLMALCGHSQKNHKAVSFFSGIGGFSLGFRSSGFEVCGFVEIDDNLSSIYKANFLGAKRLGSDITKISNEDFMSFRQEIGEVDVIIGGPPCQGFSLSGKRKIDDPRNYLFQDYLRAVDIINPKFAIIENVKLLTSMKSKDGKMVKDEIISGLNAHGYRTKLFEVNAKDYGVPQHRERAIFVAVRNDLKIEPSFPEPSSTRDGIASNRQAMFRTFGDACSDLEYIESGQSGSDPHHQAVKHPDHVINWLWDVPQGSSAHDNEDPDLRPPSGYNTTYKRQVWAEPAATVQTTFGMISGCRNVHPIATRSLTVREACRLQSFPDNYKLLGSLGTIRTGIGNAVPPLLANKIALHISSLLSNFVEIPSFEVEL